jgi:ferritin-like metal-binding protein YciE
MARDLNEARELFVAELANMLYVEQQLADDVLPKLRSEVDDKHFREAIEEHAAQTHEHVEKIRTVFVVFDQQAAVGASPAFDGLVRHHDELAPRISRTQVRDLFHASSAAHVEHHEISAYHSLIKLAALLGEQRAVQLLEENLHHEEEALEKVEKAIPERLTTQLVTA